MWLLAHSLSVQKYVSRHIFYNAFLILNLHSGSWKVYLGLFPGLLPSPVSGLNKALAGQWVSVWHSKARMPRLLQSGPRTASGCWSCSVPGANKPHVSVCGPIGLDTPWPFPSWGLFFSLRYMLGFVDGRHAKGISFKPVWFFLPLCFFRVLWIPFPWVIRVSYKVKKPEGSFSGGKHYHMLPLQHETQ